MYKNNLNYAGVQLASHWVETEPVKACFMARYICQRILAALGRTETLVDLLSFLSTTALLIRSSSKTRDQQQFIITGLMSGIMCSISSRKCVIALDVGKTKSGDALVIEGC